MLINALREVGGLKDVQIQEKLLCFGTNGATIFHGVKVGITVQLQREFAPFLIGVHCSNHKTNLTMHAVSKTVIVSKAESLLSTFHVYFFKSSKKSLEFSKTAKIIETKGLKILKHCKTHWIGMLAPLKCVLFEWHLLLVKMALDYSNHPPSRALYHLLYDIESLLGTVCILPLFKVVQYLIKIGHSRDVALCDFVVAMKQCQIILGLLYVSPNTCYSDDKFSVFSRFATVPSQSVLMKWMPDLSAEEPIEYLCFDLSKVSHNVFATVSSNCGEQEYVTPMLLASAMENVKTQCTGIVPIQFTLLVFHLYATIKFLSQCLQCLQLYSHLMLPLLGLLVNHQSLDRMSSYHY